MFRFSRRFAAAWAVVATAATAFALAPTISSPRSEADWRDGKYPVVSVSDGDTFKVRIGTKVETVRVLGIDTPEKFATRTGNAECFGKEASDFAVKTLAGKSVTLERDASQAARDQYGRILANVRLPDGSLYSLKAAGEGFALRYSYGKTPTRYDSAIRQAAAAAQKAGSGIWAACGGKRIPKGSAGDKSGEYRQKSSPEPAKPTPVPTLPATPVPAPTASSRGSSAAGFSCSDGKTKCGQMSSCAEARFHLESCGISRLDGDGDGMPCESLCR